MRQESIGSEYVGIADLFSRFPASAAPLRALAQTLLRESSELTPFECELVAAYTSYLNVCDFCMRSHAAAAQALSSGRYVVTAETLATVKTWALPPHMSFLLGVIEKVVTGGQVISVDDFAAARRVGVTEGQVHDAVLIAAAFCMYNRYVDGLASHRPLDSKAYEAMGKTLAQQGYLRPTRPDHTYQDADLIDSPSTGEQ